MRLVKFLYRVKYGYIINTLKFQSRPAQDASQSRPGRVLRIRATCKSKIVSAIASDCMIHTSPDTGAVLGRVKTLLRLLRWIDLRCLWRRPGSVRRKHRCRAHQSHWRPGARSRADYESVVVIDQDRLKWAAETQQRKDGLYNILIQNLLICTQRGDIRGHAKICTRQEVE